MSEPYWNDGLKWVEVDVPHNARQSFDWASCICGWSSGGDDYEALAAEAAEHNAEHEGQLLRCWEVSRP